MDLEEKIFTKEECKKIEELELKAELSQREHVETKKSDN